MKSKINLKEVNFPILYKLNTQGKIEQWHIKVLRAGLGTYSIFQTYGEYRGKQIEKYFNVNEGKNIGKKNETTVELQAMLEAEAKFNKKLKSGYVRSLKDAKTGKTDKIIKGGILPMLAEKYSPKAKLNFPMMVQPKLDGERCVAIRKEMKVTLWTRSRKPITSCPHIIEQVEEILYSVKGDIILDGELYVHDLDEKAFENLMSAVRKKEPTPESSRVELHVYDIADNHYTFEERNEMLSKLPDWYSHIKFVETAGAINHKEIELAHKYYTSEGYEGLMVRDPESLYQFKRTKGLMKFKSFVDSEFDIVGVEAGKDKTVVFKCKTVNGFVFGVTMHGNKDDNQIYLTKHSLWKGKKLTISYVRLTGKNRTPFHINKVKIRNDL
jgi:ATP-dependent DNA ligase